MRGPQRTIRSPALPLTEKHQFSDGFLGSASELQYFLLLARDLQLLQGDDYDRLAEKTTEVKRMLGGFLQKLKAAG
jgi:four helix bundle protein